MESVPPESLIASIGRMIRERYADRPMPAIEEVPGGRMHRIFRVKIGKPEEVFALRVGAVAASPAVDAAAENLLRGIPKIGSLIPECLGHGVLDEGIEYALLAWVDGVRLDTIRRTQDLAWAAGRLLATIHDCPGGAFADGIGVSREDHEGWRDLLALLLEKECRLLGMVAPESAALVSRAMVSIMNDVMEPDHAVLTHNDFHLRNIIARGDDLIVIDWDRAGYRHNHVDFVKPFHYNFPDAETRGAFVRGYNAGGAARAPESEEELRPYEILWRMKMIRFEIMYPTEDCYFIPWRAHAERLSDLCN